MNIFLEKVVTLEEKIKEVNPESTVNVVDGLRSIGKVYDKTVCKGYYIMATKTPKVYGKFYKITDQKNKFYKTVMKSNSMMAKKLPIITSHHGAEDVTVRPIRAPVKTTFTTAVHWLYTLPI